jgi:hypothetical protein
MAPANECETLEAAHAPEPTKENAPMLDIHPPHEAAHSWRDFFIHIATICVGLLIAIVPATRMNPNLEFAQGVHGVSTGRSWGIIDTLHLVEVARAASLVAPQLMTSEENEALDGWFRSYLEWLKTSENGKKEGDALNNHATCWALQAAEFARLIGDSATRGEVRRGYLDVLLPGQMAVDGSFPKELVRTKPYSYSIFNFDAMTMLCVSLEGTGESLPACYLQL